MTVLPQLVVPARFNGPPGSGNGGYVAGRLAGVLSTAVDTDRALPAVTVTLREPPPLEVALDLQTDEDGRVLATLGGAVIATAEPGRLAHDPVQPVTAEAARRAQRGYAGLRAHPFPGCFVCGPHRPAGDGMGLQPGRVGTDPAGPVACTWVPDLSQADVGAGGAPGTDAPVAQVAEAMVWAALDCPSGWASDLEARPMVLGRITASVDALPHVGDRCVVVARVLGDEGRKTFTASTAYDSDGRVLGRAEAVWIALR